MRTLIVILLFHLLNFGVSAREPAGFRIVSAASVNGNEIGVCFNQPLDPVSATNATHYRLSDTNVLVTSAVLRTDSHSVLLQLSREIVGYTFVLIASDVHDLEGMPLSNPIVAGGVFGHDTGGLDNTDIGALEIDPQQQGSVFGCTNGLFLREFEVLAGGSGIGERSDAFHYVYHRDYQVFDLVAQITNLTLTNGSAQAGLMVRESLGAQSRHLSVLLTISGAGGEITTLYRDTEGGISSEWPGSKKLSNVSSPVWLLLQRNGPTFSASVKTNGGNWMLLASFEPVPSFAERPQTVFAGTATSSRNNVPGLVCRFQYQYQVEPHSDVFPSIEALRHPNMLTLRWPNATVLESSDFDILQHAWVPVTNSVEFGAGTSQWNIELPRPFFGFCFL